jgi:putative ABC transport system ATP-binding protein
VVELTAVGKTYTAGDRQVAALAGVDLRIGRGRFVALLGKSGSGKSTLLNIVGAVDKPSAGRAVVDGRDLADLSPRALDAFRRERIGFVFQAFHLLATLTVAENVELPLLLAGADPADRRAELAALYERLGIAGKVGRFPEELSGGEQQRAAIARALATRPTLIIADEPTGNLDSETGRQILELLRQLQRERGVTVVMATHAADSLPFCDGVVELRDGRVIRVEGSVAEDAPRDAAS